MLDGVPVELTPEDDAALAQYLVTNAAELAVREKMWADMHGLTLKKQEARRRQREAKLLEDEKQRKRRASTQQEPRRRTQALLQADPNRANALQGVQEVVQAKKISTRIDYSALQSIFAEAESDAFAAELSASSAPVASAASSSSSSSLATSITTSLDGPAAKRPRRILDTSVSELASVSTVAAGSTTTSTRRRVLVTSAAPTAPTPLYTTRQQQQKNADLSVAMAEDTAAHDDTFVSARDELGYGDEEEDDGMMDGGEDDW
jgi:hypothetical protein